MKEKKNNKISNMLQTIFGYIMMVCLFAGSILFILSMIALIVGGDVAESISIFAYTKFAKVLIMVSSVGILIGLAAMYFRGETALTPTKKEE